MTAIMFLMFCLTMGVAALAAQPDRDGAQRDPLRGLRRAITEAGAPALAADQETQLTALITAYKEALPEDSDGTLEAAREAFDAAILAGNLTGAQAQAAIIASRSAELANARLRAEAGFSISALAVLQTGGQLTPLIEKFSGDRVLNLIGSLVGRPGGSPRH